jgi:hypothetical protein
MKHRTPQAEVRWRSNGRCEAHACTDCTGLMVHSHHVMRRGPGPDTADNLLAVCIPCHQHIHGNPAESRRRGFIRSAWPADLGELDG